MAHIYVAYKVQTDRRTNKRRIYKEKKENEKETDS